MKTRTNLPNCLPTCSSSTMIPAPKWGKSGDGQLAARSRNEPQSQSKDGLLRQALRWRRPLSVYFPTGTKSWVFMSTRQGKRREMGLGAYPATSLKWARDKAAKCRALLAEDRDPIAERNRLQEKTFRECADLYIPSMEASWRNEKHRYQWRHTLTTYCAVIREKPVSAISTDDVLSVLKPLWVTRGETASRTTRPHRTRSRFRASTSWRTSENPALWRGHLKNILPPRRNSPEGTCPRCIINSSQRLSTGLRGLSCGSSCARIRNSHSRTNFGSSQRHVERNRFRRRSVDDCG